jgi:hypothetical protein
MIFQRRQQGSGRALRAWRPASAWAQSEAEIAELEEALRQRWQIAMAPGLLGQRFPITRERATTLAADKAGDENGGIANSELRNSRISHCGSSGA